MFVTQVHVFVLVTRGVYSAVKIFFTDYFVSLYHYAYEFWGCKFLQADAMRCGVGKLEGIQSRHVHQFTWVHIGYRVRYVIDVLIFWLLKIFFHF